MKLPRRQEGLGLALVGRLTLQGMYIIFGGDIWEMEKRIASWKYFIDIQKCELLRSLGEEETHFPLLLKWCLTGNTLQM